MMPYEMVSSTGADWEGVRKGDNDRYDLSSQQRGSYICCSKTKL